MAVSASQRFAMLSLRPAQTVNAGVVERLRFVLRGSGAPSCSITVTDTDAASVRDAGKQGFVLDVDGWTAATIALRSSTGSPIKGQVVVEITPFDRSGRRSAIEVRDIQTMGQREIALVALAVTDSQECTVTSLIHDAPGAFTAACLIDRSASMAWVYQGGMLQSVLRGLGAAADDVLSGDIPRCCTFGAPTEGAHWVRALPAPKALHLLDPQPELYSSGSRIPWDYIDTLEADIVVIVTDDPRPATAGSAKLVSFIRPSPPVTVQGLPAELQQQVDACRSAGNEVLTLARDAPDVVAGTVASWFMEQIGQFVVAEEYPR